MCCESHETAAAQSTRVATVEICMCREGAVEYMHGFHPARRVWPNKLFQVLKGFQPPVRHQANHDLGLSSCHLSNEPVIILSARRSSFALAATGHRLRKITTGLQLRKISTLLKCSTEYHVPFIMLPRRRLLDYAYCEAWRPSYTHSALISGSLIQSPRAPRLWYSQSTFLTHGLPCWEWADANPHQQRM